MANAPLQVSIGNQSWLHLELGVIG